MRIFRYARGPTECEDGHRAHPLKLPGGADEEGAPGCRQRDGNLPQWRCRTEIYQAAEIKGSVRIRSSALVFYTFLVMLHKCSGQMLPSYEDCCWLFAFYILAQ